MENRAYILKVKKYKNNVLVDETSYQPIDLIVSVIDLEATLMHNLERGEFSYIYEIVEVEKLETEAKDKLL